ncbi:MAG: isocitrate/isopropylmalate family dehydrogenase, partial [Rhizobiaceae bacterium]
MSGKATILDIAERAGVSKSTVSLVLQGSGLIRPETAEKVRKAIDEVGYVYNRGAANLRKARSNVIGMVINDLTNPFFAELAVGMERVLQRAGIVPFIANTAENPVRQEEVLKSMMEQGVAGLIVSPARGTAPDAFRRLEAAGVPVVFAMRRLPESRLPSISPDNRRGASLAAEHLIGKGHRRLAFFGGHDDMVVFRENTEGLYTGIGGQFKRDTPDEVAIEAEINSRKGVERIIRAAFAYAAENGKRRVCMSDKSNAMRHGHDLWQRVFREVAREYPGIEASHLYVDVLAMEMVRDPRRFE